MRRKTFILIFLAASFFGLPSYAQTAQDRIISQLQKQGYKQITVAKTLLGRTRIEARSQEGHREIILNARTGEILRDFWEAEANASSEIFEHGGGNTGSNRNGNNGSSGGGNDFDDDDDDGSDDGDDHGSDDDGEDHDSSDDDSGDHGGGDDHGEDDD
jgi:uncharacterized membrane protein YgcG